jgi:hypothetical protein
MLSSRGSKIKGRDLLLAAFSYKVFSLKGADRKKAVGLEAEQSKA